MQRAEAAELTTRVRAQVKVRRLDAHECGPPGLAHCAKRRRRVQQSQRDAQIRVRDDELFLDFVADRPGDNLLEQVPNYRLVYGRNSA